MLHYEVDRSRLEPCVPSGTELDTWNGQAWVSLVAFRFLDTRVFGLPVPFHRDFEEINLRFYVRRDAGAETRGGVVFLREIVPRTAVALAARMLYNEPYVSRETRSVIYPGDPPSLRYECRVDSRWHSMGGHGDGEGQLAPDGSLEAFLTYRYWGYTRQRDGGTIEYEVHHPPWVLWPVHDATIDASPAELFGSGYGSWLGSPGKVCIADGSPVTVSTATRIHQAPWP